MQTILVLGAGLSSNSLLDYLSANASEGKWQVKVVDQNFEMLKEKVENLPAVTPLNFDALDKEVRREHLKDADLVISMLPARFHIEVARDCVDLKKNLITPSYVTPEMKSLHKDAISAGICIMNEIGVDPGIDHMSACRILDHLRSINADIISFKSFCGGLIAPESDNNPWNYKFTWNPRNVVLAGQGGAARFIEQNQYKYIPYVKLFSRVDEMEIEGFGQFEGYANRNSLQYRSVYNLESIPTLYRGTLRRRGYCKAWDVLVQLGLTDDSYQMENSETLTPRTFLNAFLPFKEELTVEEKLKEFFTREDEESFNRISWLGLFEDTKVIGIKDASPAQLLEEILKDKWKLELDDKDMLVMYHEFEYLLNGDKRKIVSSMVHLGQDQYKTAMADTVGLPIAICAKNILKGEFTEKGVLLPLKTAVYTPILDELETFGIKFFERDVLMS